MYDKVTQFFCSHEWIKLKNGSKKCTKCYKEKAKPLPNIRQTNSYHLNMKQIAKNIREDKRRKESEKLNDTIE